MGCSGGVFWVRGMLGEESMGVCRGLAGGEGGRVGVTFVVGVGGG